MTGWKPATQKALSSPCYTSISLLKDNTFTRSCFWYLLTPPVKTNWQFKFDSIVTKANGHWEPLVGASQTFNTALFDLDYVNSQKSRNLNIFCGHCSLWLLSTQRAPTCLARSEHACAPQVKRSIDDVQKETPASYRDCVVRILDYRHFRLLRTFLCWFVHHDRYQRKRRLRGSAIETEKLLCRDLLYLVINLMLLSVKDVKTLPFARLFIYIRLFPNNTQQLAHILMSCKLPSICWVRATTDGYIPWS